MNRQLNRESFWSAFITAVVVGTICYLNAIKENENQSAPTEDEVSISEVPMQDLSNDQLRRKLKEYVQCENFEKAAIVRDLLKTKA